MMPGKRTYSISDIQISKSAVKALKHEYKLEMYRQKIKDAESERWPPLWCLFLLFFLVLICLAVPLALWYGLGKDCESQFQDACKSLKIITRRDWMGDNSNNDGPIKAANHIFISKFEADSCSSYSRCVRVLQSHAELLKNCNFFIGGDGLIFEGKGWMQLNFHRKPGTKETSFLFHICLIANNSGDTSSSKILNEIQTLVSCGKGQGYISTQNKIHADQQTLWSDTQIGT